MYKVNDNQTKLLATFLKLLQETCGKWGSSMCLTKELEDFKLPYPNMLGKILLDKGILVRRGSSKYPTYYWETTADPSIHMAEAVLKVAREKQTIKRINRKDKINDALDKLKAWKDIAKDEGFGVENTIPKRPTDWDIKPSVNNSSFSLEGATHEIIDALNSGYSDELKVRVYSTMLKQQRCQNNIWHVEKDGNFIMIWMTHKTDINKSV